METALAGQSLTGLEFIRAIAEGRIPAPPIARTLDFLITEAEEGRVVFAVEPSEFHYNPIGVVHAGLALTLIDSAVGCAVQTMLPAGVAYTTLETKGNFVRPLTRETGRVLCEARVLHLGSRSATGEAKLTDAAGKLYAHGTSTCLVVQPRP
jgi:uncharacterized protein (TIGR00369 family)